MQRPIVRIHDVMIEKVPRCGGSATHPSVIVVELVVAASGSPDARCVWTDNIVHNVGRTFIVG
jgi:hypothetical protein